MPTARYSLRIFAAYTRICLHIHRKDNCRATQKFHRALWRYCAAVPLDDCGIDRDAIYPRLSSRAYGIVATKGKDSHVAQKYGYDDFYACHFARVMAFAESNPRAAADGKTLAASPCRPDALGIVCI